MPVAPRQIIARVRRHLGPMAWGTGVVFIIQRGADVANIACKVFLGRVLPPLDFGAVEPILATITMLSLPATIIYSTAVKSISRLVSQGRDAQCRGLIHDLHVVATVGSFLSVLVVLALRHFILSRLHLESPAYIWMIAAMFALGWWTPLALSVIRAKQRYRLMSLNRIAGPFLMVGLTVTLVSGLGFGLQGAILARVLASMLMVVLLLRLIGSYHRGTRESYAEERKAMLRMLLPMVVFMAGNTFAVSYDRLFVRNFMVNDSAGLSAIFTLGQIPRLLIAPISFVILPVAAARHASGRELGRLLRRAVVVAAIATSTCCAAFAFVATPLLKLWRPEFAPFGRLVWVYALMTGLLALNNVVVQVEMARHEYRCLWFYALPILLACAGVYYLEGHTRISVSLPTLIWTLVTAHATACLGMLIYLTLRRKTTAT